MSQPAKRKRLRKAPKAKDSSSRQTSLLDAFGTKAGSKKNTSTASAPTSENESVGLSDTIDIGSSDAEPIPEDRLDLAPVLPGVHPFHDRGNGEDIQSTQASTSGSKDVPIIIIDSSPSTSPVRVTKPLPMEPPKALFSIFAPRQRPETRRASQEPSTRGPSIPAAPYPDATTQHVRGPQTVFQAPNSTVCAFPRRLAATDASGPEDSSHPNPIREPLSSSPHKQNALPYVPMVPALLGVDSLNNSLAAIPPEHRRHPAVSRLLSQPPTSGREMTPDSASSSHLLWNDKWRPRRADEVLGNEQVALYLRDWLLALKLHIADQGAPTSSSDGKGKTKASKNSRSKAKQSRGIKRPRVVRDAPKKRRRVDSEEPELWLTDDLTEDEAPLDVLLDSDGDYLPTKLSRLKRAGTEDSLGEHPSSPDPFSSVEEEPPALADDSPPFPYAPHSFGDVVYNTILLCGPHGCGKTAAVYACAEELGWDVFEVYPGIGERSGAALNKLIGEVGKNHLVRQTQQQPKVVPPEKPVRPKAAFFAKHIVSDDEADSTPSQSTIAEQEPVQAAPVVSQSIVLIEEVDVLYEDDTNFWPTLRKIIKECRRPVVLTCNDISLVPVGDLPLQTTLQFCPCPIPLATSYLQALCLVEGRLLDCEVISRTYEEAGSNASSGSVADSALYPGAIPPSPPDLRRAINQLQLGEVFCSSPRHVDPAATAQDDQSLDALIRLAKSVALNYFVDYGLRKPGKEVLRDLLLNSQSPSADDQLGYKQLVAEPGDADSDLPVTFSTYHWDEAIRQELLSSSRQYYPSPYDVDSPHPHPLHHGHCGTLLPVLDRLHVPRDQLVRDAKAIFVDYEPYIRHMSRIDDTRVTESVASGAFEGTRQTRNSQRAQMEEVRYITLGDEELDVLRRTAFDDETPSLDIPSM
ncbi:P-loop containing nucleoside triphosphate hydrolase protein [Trametes sanguinea]|nr:P-loop containing nucleoside triphosphate hydrolase protein [Trametes sanguinea]